ncbi:CpaB family protein [Nocardioides acrostichi]|uniref:SAF domain-containing protein n=1 Tax=Nocardioides acrostichi TaxID=2784339 RepID=A0A930Y7T0_9ACTN|nr:hypothetical protein [Nocardioides acrostichi]MBF4162367.1 hypothetical protein [Nocardioides acrostichi]
MSLGTTTTARTSATGAASSGAPPAQRVSTPGWRDSRLWIGVVVLAASVVLGAKLIASADDTVAVWAAGSDLVPGQSLSADDLVATRVRFADADDLDGYLRASDPLPARGTLLRAVDAGELVPAAALGERGTGGTLSVPIAVAPEQMTAGLEPGDVVNVYLVAGKARGFDPGDPVLESVAVVQAQSPGEGFGSSGQVRVTVSTTSDDASRFYSLLGRLTDPQVFVVAQS